MEKKEYYIVDKRVLSNSIKSVIKVNEIIQKENISAYEAIKKVGISRSTYYKYKGYIKPFFESGDNKIFTIHLILIDKPGILSKILDIIAVEKINILSIVQNIAIDGVGDATISIQTTEAQLKKIEKIFDKIKSLEFVKNVRVIGNN